MQESCFFTFNYKKLTNFLPMNLKDYMKPYSKTKLAKAYGVDVRTFNKWIKPLYKFMGKPMGKLLTPLQVETIFKKIGKPNLDKLV